MKAAQYFAAVSAAIVLITTASAQVPQTTAGDQKSIALVKEIREQQAQIAANQEKIEAKLTALAEAVRQAKIYSSRGGR